MPSEQPLVARRQDGLFDGFDTFYDGERRAPGPGTYETRHLDISRKMGPKRSTSFGSTSSRNSWVHEPHWLSGPLKSPAMAHPMSREIVLHHLHGGTLPVTEALVPEVEHARWQRQTTDCGPRAAALRFAAVERAESRELRSRSPRGSGGTPRSTSVPPSRRRFAERTQREADHGASVARALSRAVDAEHDAMLRPPGRLYRDPEQLKKDRLLARKRSGMDGLERARAEDFRGRPMTPRPGWKGPLDTYEAPPSDQRWIGKWTGKRY